MSETVRVTLGDCIAGMRKLPDASVHLVIADPPYNIGVHGEKWDQVSDYIEWSTEWLKEALRIMREGAALFIYGSPEQIWISRLKVKAADLGFEFKQHISWVYTQGGDSRIASMKKYATRMEHLEWFIKPGVHTFNVTPALDPYTDAQKKIAIAKGTGRVKLESLDKGRPPRNWWDIARENSRSAERKHGHHPCMKPLKLSDRIVRVHTNAGETVLVPFGGSGSECLAAAKAGRRVVAFENNETYYDIIIKRLSAHSILHNTSETTET